MSLLLQLNYALFQSINSQAGVYPWLDALMVFSANYLVFLLPIPMLLMWGRPLAWRGKQLSSGEQEILRERRAAVLWVAIACIAAYILNLLVEQVVFEIAGAFPLLLVPVGEGGNSEDAGNIGGKSAVLFAYFAKLHTFGLFEQTFDMLRSHLVGGKIGTMHEIQFFVGKQTCACEIGGANDGGNGLETIKATAAIE